MIIEEHVVYNKNGETNDKTIRIDTSLKGAEISEDIADAVSFALFGKTVFRDIVREDTGVLFITLRISNCDKEAYVVRQPEYVQVTHFGSKTLNKEVFGINDKSDSENTETPYLSAEEYFKQLDKYIDMKCDDFKAFVLRDCSLKTK